MKSENTALQINNVTKTYKLYKKRSDRVKETFHPLRRKYSHPFHALTNISFQVQKGETLGIVGRNGSGKSTLLQLITGVLAPTQGEITVNGKIAAILELGSGFSPEFTGRENIYLNSTIMEVEAETIEEYIDDIITFAELGDFIDQPLKTYSSGMKARLAFALSINVSPDILIIDEALSVGDEAFQRKCFARIESFRKSGGTVLFVSHGANTIVQLCNRAILLDKGELLMLGSPKKVVAQYQKLIYSPPEKLEALRKSIKNLKEIDNKSKDEKKKPIPTKNNTQKQTPTPLKESESKPFFDPNLKPKSTVWYESRGSRIQNPEILTIDGQAVNNLSKGEEYIFTYQVSFTEEAFNVRFGMLIKTKTGFEIGGIGTAKVGEGIEYVEPGSTFAIQYRFRCICFPGTYFANAAVLGIKTDKEEFLHRGIDVFMFRVLPQKDRIFSGVVDFYLEPSVEQIA